MTGTDGLADIDASRPDALRKQMVEELLEQGWIRTERVAAAFGALPRHVFAPGEPLDRAYSVVATLLAKRDEDGAVISTVSAPHLQALMLEQAKIEPGMRVLEIGTGGYNAALLAEVVGPAGEVTTMDIDPEVVDRAQMCLSEAGYDRVDVVLGDAEAGASASAPFDRVIVTAGAWDIPPAWVDQLADGGRIVVPLRIRGLTRSVAFEPVGDRLVCQEYELCSFVPFQGAGAQDDVVVALDDDVRLRLEGSVEHVDSEALSDVLSQPRVEAWSGVTVGEEDRFDGLQLWLALGMTNFGFVLAERAAVERGVVAHAWPLGLPAAVTGRSLAYLGLRPVDDDGKVCEFGAYGHGPDAEELVAAVLQRTQSWDRTSLSAQIDAYPAGTPDEELPAGAYVFDKKHRRIAITWPDNSSGSAQRAQEQGATTTDQGG